MIGGGNGRAFVPSTAILDEVMEALTLTITTTPAAAAAAATASDRIVPCCHGSTSTHFPDGRAYSDVITKCLSVCKEKEGMIAKFVTDHKEMFRDLNFGQYIFAVCTSWYLKTNTTNGEMHILLLLAMLHKYSDDPDKVKRYSIAMQVDRGVINCLSRETKSFCECMQDKKTEAKGMAKTELCFGCDIIFPRKDMLKCSGCKIVMFCNEDCQTQNWPKHRENCQGFQKYELNN